MRKVKFGLIFFIMVLISTTKVNNIHAESSNINTLGWSNVSYTMGEQNVYSSDCGDISVENLDMSSYTYITDSVYMQSGMPEETLHIGFFLYNNTNAIVERKINLGVPGIGYNNVEFDLYDIDGMDDQYDRRESVTVTGYYDGVPVLPDITSSSTMLNISNNIITGYSAVAGNPDLTTGPTGGDSPDLGRVHVSFPTAIDSVILSFTVDVGDGALINFTTSPAYSLGDVKYNSTMYTVFYNAASHGSVDTASFEVCAGDANPVEPSLSVDSGYEFLGWTTDDSVDPDQVLNDITYIASYQQKIQANVSKESTDILPETGFKNYAIIFILLSAIAGIIKKHIL
ncbi:MAG: hypothetical protein ACK5K7_01080 [Bacilli bacterium]